MQTLNKNFIFHFKSQTWLFLPFLSPQQDPATPCPPSMWVGGEFSPPSTRMGGHCHGWQCSHHGLMLATPSAPNQPGLVFSGHSTLSPQDTFPGDFSSLKNGSILCSENWRENTTSNQTNSSCTLCRALGRAVHPGWGREGQLDPAQGFGRRVGICLTPGTGVKALLKINTSHARMAHPRAPHKQGGRLPAPINKHHGNHYRAGGVWLRVPQSPQPQQRGQCVGQETGPSHPDIVGSPTPAVTQAGWTAGSVSHGLPVLQLSFLFIFRMR